MMPAIYVLRVDPAAGGLMSYGTSLADANRQGGIYVGRILKGVSRPRPLSCHVLPLWVTNAVSSVHRRLPFYPLEADIRLRCTKSRNGPLAEDALIRSPRRQVQQRFHLVFHKPLEWGMCPQ